MNFKYIICLFHFSKNKIKMNIGYVKYKCYIITIEAQSNENIPLYKPVHNLECAYYKCVSPD